MQSVRRWLMRGAIGLSLTVTATAGCQTYPAGFGGLTLPSPHYLDHYPQYFPPDPAYPLQRELDSMQDPAGAVAPGVGGGVAPLPAPVVPGAPVPAGPGGAAVPPGR